MSDAASDESTQIHSPMTDYEMLTKLDQAVDFSIKQPILSDSYTVFSFFDINKTTGQIIYENGG